MGKGSTGNNDKKLNFTGLKNGIRINKDPCKKIKCISFLEIL